MTGRLFALAAGITYGTLGIFSTLFYDHGGSSFTLLVLRFCGGVLVIAVGTAVPALFFYSSIRLIGAGAAARLATIEPLTAVVLSYIVLHDSLSATQVVGGAVLLTSVVLLAATPAAVRPVEPVLEP
jgi:drug/metabolite transporter (DMT)-like permease